MAEPRAPDSEPDLLTLFKPPWRILRHERADLVVLDRDILSIDPETIEDTRVVATFLDGRLVYAAPASATMERPKDEEVGNWWRARNAGA
jgi:hypothetical protein